MPDTDWHIARLYDFASRAGRQQVFEGQLPDFNLGTFNGLSCAPGLARELEAMRTQHPAYSHVLNGRFKGGDITRHYGRPVDNLYAVQLELAQCTYIDGADD